ncbi:hypothetical protein EVAR_65748_1 [Eumeta japonica]|uniref:Uncharacterized protein n=1 Tax=Eumeta variegata TaxID=151549 RepID=A0A4C1ZK57_EUMVA|nr:hypothetical protein EVAR_65748_1 [Eumeta japonica]
MSSSPIWESSLLSLLDYASYKLHDIPDRKICTSSPSCWPRGSCGSLAFDVMTLVGPPVNMISGASRVV